MPAEILVVSADPHVLSERVTGLRRAGYSPRASSSFPEARRALEEGPAPDILVTDVRLGPYNGLHLVAIARVEFPRACAIVIGGADPALEVEAGGLGARYLSGPVGAQALHATIEEVTAVERPRRRWPRKRLPTEIAAVIGGLPGRLLDVSYGGACLELFGGAVPADAFDIMIPELGMDLRGMRVWTHRADPLQPASFGVALSEADPRWQQYVDAVA